MSCGCNPNPCKGTKDHKLNDLIELIKQMDKKSK